ncbi:cytochrome P450 family protein [Actibacterium pelagium]|uniref:Uncharacterized protein n=1 Tax=Actibacterium pelagium TaxID=2029103 RepID=A0A917AE21_9RHOB|nr:hypothetical protein [Actibacterium pelagium]GGE45402.1 hypothetical protein GCM10011517_11270 [Actibacterium pelagium]
MDDYSLLHRQPDRIAVYKSSDRLEWNDGLGTWFSADIETIQKILRDREVFHVVNFRLIYESFADRFGLDFRRLVKVLDHVPLGLNGEEHMAERRAQTLYLKQAVPDAAKAFEETFDEHLTRVLDAAGEADFLTEVLLPSNTAMFFELTGLPAEKDQLRASWSQIFDRKISLNRRLKIDAQVAAALEQFREELSPDDTLRRLALNIVGADSIIASCSESVAAVLRAHLGQRLCEMNWPEEMPRTGVPYVDRIVAHKSLFWRRCACVPWQGAFHASLAACVENSSAANCADRTG